MDVQACPSFGHQCDKDPTLYLIETPFNTFANIAGSTQFAYGNMIRYDPTLVDMTSNFFVLCTMMKVYLYNYS